MKRLHLSTAILLALSATASAQVAPPLSVPAEEVPTTGVGFVAAQNANEIRLGDLMGRPINNAENGRLGDVSSLVFNRDGSINAAIVGVGGILGIGARNVAIRMDRLEIQERDDTFVWWFDTTRSNLTDAPSFVRFDPDEAARAALPSAAGFVTRQDPDTFLVSEIDGRPIVDTADDTLATVADLVLRRDGQIVAVVANFGGFLGIGDRNTGVAYAALEPVRDEDGDVHWGFDATREQLEAAPDFMTDEDAADAAVGAVEETDRDGDEQPLEEVVGFDFVGLAAEVTPAVVSVRLERATSTALVNQDGVVTYFSDPDVQQPPRPGLGSGFFVSPDGFIVTNNHIVANANRIEVVLEDGATYSARLVGADPRTDIALLKVDAEERAFPFVTFSHEEVQIGQWAVAAGNPYGLGGTITLGIVSALGRDIGAGPYDDFMQLDAAINGGNSGGPSFNLAGEVIGVNTAMFSQTETWAGVGFAIPASIVSNVVADLQDDGIVQRGWLGVQMQDIDEDLADALGLEDSQGALVVNAAPGTPAAIAGIGAGDTITAVDGDPIDDPRDLARTIAAREPQDDIALTIWRGGEPIMVDVVLAALPGEEEPMAPLEDDPEARPTEPIELLGFSVAAADASGPDTGGIVVISIDAAGLAAESTLREGMIIVEADGRNIVRPGDLTDAIVAARAIERQTILLRVTANDATEYVALRVGDAPE